MIGKDCLGLLEDDEACLPQVNFALQAKFGRQVTFKAGKKSMLKQPLKAPHRTYHLDP